MKTNPLNGGRVVAIIDDADAERVMSVGWTAYQRGTAWYAKMSLGPLGMHRFVLNAPAGAQVDHINGNGLDNRRVNLRLCTNRQNQQNRQVANGASGYKGVTLCPKTGRWQARIRGGDIRADGRRRELALGRFDTKEQAALAYDMAALRMFGEFAKLNFPGEHLPPARGEKL